MLRHFTIFFVSLFLVACGSEESNEASLTDVGSSDGGESTEAGGESTEAGGESAEDGGESTEAGGESTEAGGESTEDGGESAEAGGESTEDGGESTEDGGESTEAGGESTEDGGESTEAGGESTESGGESTTEGGGAPVEMAGTWLLWSQTGGCGDFDLMSTKFAEAKYAVLTVTENGDATITLHEAAYETFREYSFPSMESEGISGGAPYVVSIPEVAVEEPPGSGCTINRSATLTLESTAGGFTGTLEYSELKKGGGCFSDGCEGVLDVAAQDLGSAVNPLYLEGSFPYSYSNPIDGVTEEGEMVVEAAAGQPYFFFLDIPTVGSALQVIRGKAYVVGQGGNFYGRAALFSYDEVDELCWDYYDQDIWDLQIYMDASPEFGGTLEHTVRTYGADCELVETKSSGLVTAP